MQVKVDRVSEKTIFLEEDIPASLWDMDSFDIKFINDIHLNCKFSRVGEQIFVKGKVLAHRKIICSRCLAEVEDAVMYPFILVYNIASLGEYLNIDNDVREEILLNFPMKVLCKPDCKGICARCGVNLNIEECRCRNSLQIEG